MSSDNLNKVPHEWIRKEKTRKGGRTDVTYKSPNGTCIRSKKKLKEYFEEKNPPCQIEDFSFEKLGITEIDKRRTEKMETETCVDVACELNISKDLELNESLISLSESCLQLKFERDKKEESLSLMKREADEIILKCECEIKVLNDNNLFLKSQIKRKEEEISSLKNSICLENVSVKENSNIIQCLNCEVNKIEILSLKNKIIHLKKENLQIMETILPHSLPDKKLQEELQEKNNIIQELIENANVNQMNLNEKNNVLQRDFKQISLENQKLKNEIIKLKISCEELFYENKTKKSNKHKASCKPANETRIFLQNRFNILSQSEDSTEEDNNNVENLSLHEELTDIRRSRMIKQKFYEKEHSIQLSKSNYKNILVLADSHGRDISSYLSEIWPSRTYKISSFYKPNATLHGVIQDLTNLIKTHTKKDYVVIMGGSNDNLVNEENQLIDSFVKVIESTAHTNLIVAGLPYRHHSPGQNNKVTFINMKIEELVHSHKHATFLPLSHLSRKLHTKQGLHFNKLGKRKIASMIKDIVNPKGVEVLTTTNQTSLMQENNIQVIEADMREMIDKYKEDSTVGFAHTISSDLHDHRSMSAGVAVVFKNSFEKPKRTDFVSDKLTCQEVKEGAKIYSLVTKPTYWGKPRTDNYEEAFQQLTRHFSKCQLKTLVCSPMGCVRDMVQPSCFIANLVKFQLATGATVLVISKDQNAHRILRNGLSHPGFVKNLREEINRYVAPPKDKKVIIQSSIGQIVDVASCSTPKHLSSDCNANCTPTLIPDTEVSTGKAVPNLQDLVIFPLLPSSPNQHLQSSQDKTDSDVKWCKGQSTAFHTKESTPHISASVLNQEGSRPLSETLVSDIGDQCNNLYPIVHVSSQHTPEMSQPDFL